MVFVFSSVCFLSRQVGRPSQYRLSLLRVFLVTECRMHVAQHFRLCVCGDCQLSSRCLSCCWCFSLSLLVHFVVLGGLCCVGALVRTLLELTVRLTSSTSGPVKFVWASSSGHQVSRANNSSSSEAPGSGWAFISPCGC